MNTKEKTGSAVWRRNTSMLATIVACWSASGYAQVSVNIPQTTLARPNDVTIASELKNAIAAAQAKDAVNPGVTNLGGMRTDKTRYVVTQQPASQSKLQDTVASNIATVDQTDGAWRLMLFVSAAPSNAHARPSVVSLGEFERENGRR